MGYLETIAGQFGIAAWLIAIILIAQIQMIGLSEMGLGL